MSAFTALYVRSGGLGGMSKHPSDNISPRNTKSHKNSKNQSNSGGSKMGGDSTTNYIFTFLVSVVGPAMTAKFPEGVERTCGLISIMLFRVVVWLMTLKNYLLTIVGVSGNSKNLPPSSSKMTESFGKRTMSGKQKTATKKSSNSNHRSDLKVDVAVANGVATTEGSDDDEDQNDRDRKHSTEEEEDTASTEDDRLHTMDDEDIFRATIGDAAYRAAAADMDEADLKVHHQFNYYSSLLSL